MFAELAVEPVEPFEGVFLLAQDQVQLGLVDILVRGQGFEGGVLTLQFLHQLLLEVATFQQRGDFEYGQQGAVGAPVPLERFEVMKPLHQGPDAQAHAYALVQRLLENLVLC